MSKEERREKMINKKEKICGNCVYWTCGECSYGENIEEWHPVTPYEVVMKFREVDTKGCEEFLNIWEEAKKMGDDPVVKEVVRMHEEALENDKWLEVRSNIHRPYIEFAEREYGMEIPKAKR